MYLWYAPRMVLWFPFLIRYRPLRYSRRSQSPARSRPEQRRCTCRINERRHVFTEVKEASNRAILENSTERSIRRQSLTRTSLVAVAVDGGFPVPAPALAEKALISYRSTPAHIPKRESNEQTFRHLLIPVRHVL